MKILIIALIVVVLLVGGGLGFMMMKGGSETADAEGAAAEPVEVKKDPLYASLNPAFLVTFKDEKGLRYLQTEIEVMSYEAEVISEIEMNRPMIRNALLMHLAGQDYEIFSEVEGREQVRASAKDAVQETLRTELPVEEIYFNTFVIQ